MSELLALTAPLLLVLGLTLAVRRDLDGYRALTEGARRGLRLMLDIFPALLVLFPAIALLRASSLLEMLEARLSPLLLRLGIPPETGLLLMLRPFSGSAALAAAAELIERCGPDSLTGRTAAVMIGSSETTLYVAAVYLSAAGVKNSRWAIPAALCADLACFLSAAWICRLLWG